MFSDDPNFTEINARLDKLSKYYALQYPVPMTPRTHDVFFKRTKVALHQDDFYALKDPDYEFNQKHPNPPPVIKLDYPDVRAQLVQVVEDIPPPELAGGGDIPAEIKNFRRNFLNTTPPPLSPVPLYRLLHPFREYFIIIYHINAHN